MGSTKLSAMASATVSGGDRPGGTGDDSTTGAPRNQETAMDRRRPEPGEALGDDIDDGLGEGIGPSGYGGSLE